MKIGVIIPHRNNRPHFLKNCFRMIDAQTVQPDKVLLVNDSPINEKKDITWRYRNGYDQLRNKGFDALFLMEDDDWYAPDYIEVMINEWIRRGTPDLLGLDYTIYYHLLLKKHFIFNHPTRSSAMSTLIKPDLDFQWCPDHDPYTDIHLWNILKGQTFHPEKHICCGIKHGIGMSGGQLHNTRVYRYKTPMDISEFMDKESADFYLNYFETHPDELKYVQQEISQNVYKND